MAGAAKAASMTSSIRSRTPRTFSRWKGPTMRAWITAEQAAMHVIDPDNLDDSEYVGDETDAQRADPFRDQFDEQPTDLTPEDETILGVDPYDQVAR